MAESRNVLVQLARLDDAAESAGVALACAHQSADELHRELVRDYLELRAPRRTLLAFAAVAALLSTLLLAF